MDATPPVGYGGGFMALLTALDTRPSGAIAGLPAQEQGVVDSTTTMDLLQPSMGDVATDVAGSSSTMDIGSSTMALNNSGPYYAADGCRTPQKRSTAQTPITSFLPDCDEELKPTVGMSFESLEAVEEFYKTYAHDSGFAVRIGAQTKVLDVVENKRFLCSRQGFSRKKSAEGVVASNVDPCGKQKKPKVRMETRCGCNAHIYVKLGPDKRYFIASMVEQHNHGLVSPDKIAFLRSNRSISERVKTALFTCHKASIGTSQAYRLLQVSDGIDNIGCMKRDLQNYYRGLRQRIKDADAELFVAQMERKKEANSAFFYDFVVDEHGKLVYIFWADATSRKNYRHFGDVVSFDATYSTNQYNMKFAPFIGVNHHLQSVFLGAAFIIDEKIESYEWVFRTFLSAMGGHAPRIIITDEDASMKSAIRSILPDTIHRFCMWHIMEKMPEKVGPPTNKDEQFWEDLNKCVWGSEMGEEFEMRWNTLIVAYGLQGNEWLANRYAIRESWIPAFFMDIPLAGLLRTTSRSESSNSFFNHFIHRKLSFVEFWLRFDTALECQRHEELKADNISIHSSPLLSTPWPLEKQGSILYTHAVFKKFQKEVIAARDRCYVVAIMQQEGVKVVIINDGSMRDRVVQWCTSTVFGSCSCKLYETMGILCRHIILTLRGERLYELPSAYILKSSNEGMDFLVSGVMSLEASFGQIVPSKMQAPQEEYETFIGCKIPEQVDIHPPTDVCSKGRSKRIKKSKELPKSRKRKNDDKETKKPRKRKNANNETTEAHQ